MAATLFVVATPLGNLGDLTLRAAEVLRAVPVVAAEDTRRVRGLLTHLGAHPKVLSFHAHSPERRHEVLLEILEEGRDVALVTDAGTPGVSDPGEDLVQAAREAEVPVVPIPGPSAVTTALSASGLPANRYAFLGFLPRKGKERQRLLAAVADSEWTVVLYEAPGRLVELLADLAEVAGPEPCRNWPRTTGSTSRAGRSRWSWPGGGSARRRPSRSPISRRTLLRCLPAASPGRRWSSDWSRISVFPGMRRIGL